MIMIVITVVIASGQIFAVLPFVRGRGVGPPRDAVVGRQVTRPLSFVKHDGQPQHVVVIVTLGRDGQGKQREDNAFHLQHMNNAFPHV